MVKSYYPLTSIQQVVIFNEPEFLVNDYFVTIKPTDIPYHVLMSGYVVQRLIVWAIKNHYVVLTGTLTVPTRNLKRTYKNG